MPPAPGSDLDRFGAHLLGYDAFSGEDLPFPDGIAQAVPDWRELTQDPRKYGFHATLKAPMALADGKTEAELARGLRSLRRYAAADSGDQARRQFDQRLHRGGARASASAELERLAADCVREFDAFRAPLTPEDRARRNPVAADAEAARLSRSLGISLCDGRVSLPHDADGPA